jgi:hypothetical protein
MSGGPAAHFQTRPTAFSHTIRSKAVQCVWLVIAVPQDGVLAVSILIHDVVQEHGLAYACTRQQETVAAAAGTSVLHTCTASVTDSAALRGSNIPNQLSAD